MENESLLQGAITKMRAKVKPTPATDVPNQFVQEDAHRQLYPLLEIYDTDQSDPDINDKAKFIHTFLTDDSGTARDKIMHILNELPPISNEPTLSRVYKYCRLKEEYRKTIKRAEVLNQRIKGI